MDIYKDRILPIFQKSGMNDRQLEREIGLPKGILYDWKKERAKNYEKYCGQIASYFHVSTDYLLGNTDDPSPAGQKESPPQGGELIQPEWYTELTPDEREQVRRYAEFLIAERRKDQP